MNVLPVPNKRRYEPLMEQIDYIKRNTKCQTLLTFKIKNLQKVNNNVLLDLLILILLGWQQDKQKPKNNHD